MTETTKKALPDLISEQIHFPLDYIIIRGKTSKRAYRTVTREPGQGLWLKLVHDERLGYQLQFTFRFLGRDFWFGDAEDIDIDAYVPIDELWEELLTILQDMAEVHTE